MLRTWITCVIGVLAIAGCQRSAEIKAGAASFSLKPLNIIVTDDNGNPVPATEFRCGKRGAADYGDCKVSVMVLWESDTKCWALAPYNKLTMYFTDLPPGQRRVEWSISGGKDAEFSGLTLSKKNPGDPHAPDAVWDKDTSNNKAYKVSMKSAAPSRQEFKHLLEITTKDATGQSVICHPIDPLIVNEG